MHVCLYFSSLQGAGGAERMVIELGAAMRARDFEVDFVSLDTPDAESFYPLPDGAPWHRIGPPGGLMNKFARVAKLRNLLRANRIDVLVGFVMGADKTIHAAAHLAGVGLIAAERNTPAIYRDRLSRPAQWLYWLLFRLCDRIAVQLPAYVEGYPRFLRARIVCIPNPVRTAALRARPAGHSASPTILNVGRLHHQKGQDILLSAFAIVAPEFPEWRLRIVGEGGERSILSARARALGLADRVDMPGQTSDVASEYAAAHIFAFPSRYEGFPNALAEAQAHGLPTIGLARCEGAAALIADQRNGLLVADDDDTEAGFANALRRLMADPVLRQRLGDADLEPIASHDPHDLMEQWASMLVAVSRPGSP